MVVNNKAPIIRTVYILKGKCGYKEVFGWLKHNCENLKRDILVDVIMGPILLLVYICSLSFTILIFLYCSEPGGCQEYSAQEAMNLSQRGGHTWLRHSKECGCTMGPLGGLRARDLCPPIVYLFLYSITLPSEKVKKLKAYHTACLNQTSANTSLIEAAGKGEFVEDSRLKEYFLCLSKKIQFQNEDGEIQKNVLRQKMTEVFRDPLVTQQLIEKCAVKQDSPQNTAFNTLKCYYENTPNHVNIFQVIDFDLIFVIANVKQKTFIRDELP
ncbi:hypothetical protein NQ317_010901 [Molorchus minor]|uniref:Uncharacterized protein n=1 Tax=Molorchus minor TaxID=1323400 RepID=A0ABQ9JPX0_9CUCU|nr:hypothetical protein NQ317_010901 [Molorchus minor]